MRSVVSRATEREELLMKPFADITHPDDLAPEWANAQRLLAGEAATYAMEKRYLRKEGGITWINLTVSVQRRRIRCAQQPSFASSKTSTSAKEAEAAVRESEMRFQILADSAPVLIWMNGTMGAEFVNRAYLEFIGVSHQIDVKKFDWAQYVHPDDRDGYVSTYLKKFEKRAMFDAQFRFRRHDGEYRWMRSIATPRLSLNGELLGYVGANEKAIIQAGASMLLTKEAAVDELYQAIERVIREVPEPDAQISL